MLRLFLPAYQQTTEPIEPAVAALTHPAPRTPARFTGDLLRFLAATAHVRREAKCAQGRTHFFIIIACIQAHAVRSLLRRLRSLHDDARDRLTHQFHSVAIGAINRHADGDAMPLGQQRPLDARFPAIGWIGAGFFPPLAAPWSSPRPSSASPSQCPAVHRTVRRRPASVSGTRQRRPTPESDHTPWIWDTGPSHLTPPTDSRCGGRTRWRRRSGDRTRGDDRRQTDGCSRGPAGAVPARPTGRPRCESRSWSCCLVCAHACAWVLVQCSYDKYTSFSDRL